MADLITGETVEEARRLAELFLAMIRGEKLSEEDLEDLDEAAQLQDISHMPARVQMRRARLAHPPTACSRGKLTSSVCSESKVFDCRAAQYGRLCFPNEHEHTKSARPAPRLSFTTRPDANTGVFHSTKACGRAPGPPSNAPSPVLLSSDSLRACRRRVP